MSRKHVITAFAESASGPGWGNRPIRVILQDGDGALSQVWVQPQDQTEEMVLLYSVSQAAHLAMVAAVEKAYEG